MKKTHLQVDVFLEDLMKKDTSFDLCLCGRGIWVPKVTCNVICVYLNFYPNKGKVLITKGTECGGSLPKQRKLYCNKIKT